MSESFEVPCPICKKAVIWSAQSPYRPFCSKRCQLIDLGEWAAEEKSIPCETADFAMNEQNEDWRM
ncbi:DNA gyrase inhibitor YacG [[Haemophilus] felis]|uniref:DNA gyrase inhibitor YacG n=1 Tax=[Haemophilus] felis TaxID=123822 RepID=A0A1T0B645_9PAST|nr:DNA gyrase inhibitor YacG [[Haemophilus] felis]NBI40851.1 DNA gyrase inhibitor YacG [[Haemophilus] felis]OOS05554.1 DNA gyrase inhibitor YacG [[Haemophilus] felis]